MGSPDFSGSWGPLSSNWVRPDSCLFLGLLLISDGRPHGLGQKICPFLHDRLAFFEEVGGHVGLLYLLALFVTQDHFGGGSRDVVRACPGPVSETRPAPVGGGGYLQFLHETGEQFAGYVMTSTLRWEDHALTTFGLIPAVEKNVPGVKKNLYSLAGEGDLVL